MADKRVEVRNRGWLQVLHCTGVAKPRHGDLCTAVVGIRVISFIVEETVCELRRKNGLDYCNYVHSV